MIRFGCHAVRVRFCRLRHIIDGVSFALTATVAFSEFFDDVVDKAEHKVRALSFVLFKLVKFHIFTPVFAAFYIENTYTIKLYYQIFLSSI